MSFEGWYTTAVRPGAAHADSLRWRRYEYYVGLDLGQAQDYTALAVLEKHWPTRERTLTLQNYRGCEYRKQVTEALPEEYHCRHVERLPLGTSYPDVVRVVRRATELLETPQLHGRTRLVVDYTGCGRPVVDMLRDARLEPIAVTITGGDSVTSGPGGLRVPKRDLVGAAQVLLQSKRLKIAEELEHTPALVRELLEFKMKIDPVTAHDSYSAWREGAHDDLVLALAIACWYGERYKPTPIMPSFSYVSL